MLGTAATGKGLRGIAIFEVAKGTLVLAGGFGLLRYANGGVLELAEAALIHLHFDPNRNEIQAFLRGLQMLDQIDPRLIALGATGYAVFRYVEAYGLWKGRGWAEWMAALSTGLYVPFEVYEIWLGFSWIKAGITAANVAVLVFILAAFRAQRARRNTNAALASAKQNSHAETR